MSNDIWSNSLTRTEERKLIQQFWVELSKEERRSLISVEKKAVLLKIKDQQKNTCNCSVCGKTRHHVESELEVLYDAYFKELEKYAYYQKQILEQDDNDDDEDEDEDDYDDEDEDADTDNELVDNFEHAIAHDMSDKNVKKGGEKLLSITHKFSEKKRIREEEAELESDEDEEDDEDDDDEDTVDGECKSDARRKQDAMKMFTVFAARMFEQRVLAAYREKVAQDRQRRLIEELEEEDRKKQEREMKKQKEKEEKKNKKRLLKLQQEREREEEEDRKRKEELAAIQKQEEQRQQREQERIKREQERQKKEAERIQKELERKKKRLQEKEAERKLKEEERRLKEEEKRLKEEERKRKEEETKRKEEEMKRRDEEKKRKEEEKKKEQPVVNESEPNVHHHVLTDQSNISSTMDLTRELPLAGPIGPPTKTVHKRLSLHEHTHRSFFSKYLFEQPTNKRFYTAHDDTAHSPKRPSTRKWTNGWTPLNALSENVHEKLFGDVFACRYAMIIERTRVAYKKLDDMFAVRYLTKPHFHSLADIHRTVNEAYSDSVVVGIREIYEAITKYTMHEFECILSEEHGYIVIPKI